MKIAVIGDIHGRTIWKDIVKDAKDKVDKIVFLGDYVDPYAMEVQDPIQVQGIPEKYRIIKSFNSYVNEKKAVDWESGDEDLSDEEYYNKYYKKNTKLGVNKNKNYNLYNDDIEPTPQDIQDIESEIEEWEEGDDLLSDEEYYKKYYPNLKFQKYEETVSVLEEIIDFKKKNNDKVILIIGNHDAHYLYDEISPCGRWDQINFLKYEKIYRHNKELFQYAYQIKNHLFTHAGVSNKWLDFFDGTLLSFGLKDDNSNIGEILNKMGETKLSNKILNVAGIMRKGNAPYGGITWAHITETNRDYLKGFNQYVGHSKVRYIHTEKTPTIPGSITYCDVLETPNKNIKYNYHIVHY